MFLTDNSKNCDIITSSFSEDLLDFTVNDGKIIWSDANDTPIVKKINNLFDNNTEPQNYWKPNFIIDDSLVDNKILSHYGSIVGDSHLNSGRIGIEDVFSFNPKFKNWQTTGTMTIDWILNRSNNPYHIEAGINYWSKDGVAVTGTLQDFPIYSRLKYNNIQYIKIDNDSLRRISPDPVRQNIFTSNSVSHSYAGIDSDTPLSSLGSNPIFTLVSSDSKKIWIADGDVLLYYNNNNEKQYSNNGHKSYISGSLYQYYNSIYNAITSNELIENIKNYNKSLKTLRLYKKLAHCLATSPFVSDFFVAFLAHPSANISASIKRYLDSDPKAIDNLNNILIEISKEYSSYEINSNNNIVTNDDELFMKLFNKYGAKLKLKDSNNTITYNSLKHGDSAIIEEIGNYLVSKDEQGTDIIANKTISFPKLSIETNLSKTSSSISLKYQTQTKNIIHLYDSVKPDVKPSKLCIFLEKDGKNQSTNENSFIFFWDRTNRNPRYNLDYPSLNISQLLNLNIKYVDAQDPNQAKNLINNELVCEWQQLSGPKLKFIDLSRYSRPQDITNSDKTYDKAYGTSVILIPKSTGKYTIKCSVSSPFGSYTLIKTLFIVDKQSNEYTTKEDIEDLFNLGPILAGKNINDTDIGRYIQLNKPLDINKDGLNVFVANLDSIAIHRNGLFVPIRSNHYVNKIVPSLQLRDRIEKLNDNYVFLFDENSAIKPEENDSSVIITYSLPQNVCIKLDRIILRNLRNNKPECSQCYSLYKPKFRSVIRGVNNRPFFERSNQRGADRSVQEFSLQQYLWQDMSQSFVKSISPINYKYPIISTDLSAPIKTYGGYGYGVLDKLTIKNIDSITSPDPANKGLVSTNPIILPAITGYDLNYKDDNVDLSDDNRTYKICYEKNVMPNGFIEFQKGCFIPNSGWKIGDNSNLSSVLKFNPGARKSFNFIGPSILSLYNYCNIDESNISPKVFTSSIQLDINKSIQWFPPRNTRNIPDGNNQESQKNQNAKRKALVSFDNQLKKELADQYIRGINPNHYHGYRILNGGIPKATERNAKSNSTPQNDEFNIKTDEENNKFLYSFNVFGHPNPINMDDKQKEFIDLYVNKGIEPGSEGDALKVRNYIDNNIGLDLRNPRINNLSIRDIEVKLNFLSYVNTKNLAIWLDVEFSNISASYKAMSEVCDKNGRCRIQDQISSNNIFVDQFIANNTYGSFNKPNTSEDFASSDQIETQNSEINNFLKKLTDANSLDSTGKLRLYLLNQESIQNNDYGFSIKFSDRSNKDNVLFDHNLFTQGKVKSNQRIINNGDSIRPTINIDGYNTKNNCTYKETIDFNKININNNTFNKFANKLLFEGFHDEIENRPMFPSPPYDGSTTFTLNIAVLDEEDEMRPLDNCTNTDLFTNLASVDNNLVSANIFNNLCSWELIIHTEDVNKPIVSQVNTLSNYGAGDALSVIDYGENPKYPGYSFIADLSDKKFLLPLINMNAPNSFFQNYSPCEYSDNELIGRGLMFNPPRFPSEALIFILAGIAVGGMTGSLVGVLVGGLGPTYALGFQLLYDYFRESRIIPALEEAQRETYDFEYDSYPMGSPDKILLNVSKDGIFWYKVEASIFKLSNTPALPLKQYKFVKNESKLFKFNFNIITNSSEIIDPIFLPSIIKKFGPVEDIDSLSENNNFLDILELVTFNKLIHSKNIFQSKNDRSDTLIIIDHDIPYNLIDIGDNVPLLLDDNKKYFVVSSKALIYKDNKYQTVLGLKTDDASISEFSELLLPENVIAVYDDQSTLDNNIESPISLFGLNNDQPPYDIVPEVTFSTNSIGSYGDGSNIKNKNILSRTIRINNIEPLYKILNNFENDKYNFNNLNLIFNGNNINIKKPFAAYPVYYDSTNDNIIQKENFYITDIENNSSISEIFETIGSSLKDYRSYYKDSKFNIMYLKIKDIGSNETEEPGDGDNSSIVNLREDSIDRVPRNTIGNITIENSYTYKNSVQNISQEQLDILTNRLAVLNSRSNDSISRIVGISNRTDTILRSGSIYYVQNHYESLDFSDENKLKTYNKLNQLHNEKNEILKVLQDQCVASANIQLESGSLDGIIQFETLDKIKLVNHDQIIDKDSIKNLDYTFSLNPEKQIFNNNENNKFIPDQNINITKNPDDSVSIDYSSNSDKFYWINIDPKQSCSIAEELRPKVLKSISYECSLTNPNNVFNIEGFNNICSNWQQTNGLSNEEFTISAEPGVLPGSNKTTYKINDTVITNNKTKLEQSGAKHGWKEQVIIRRFRIHNNDNIKGQIPNMEFLVKCTEIYDIALTQFEKESATSSVKELIDKNIIKSDNSGDVTGRLLDGIGENSTYVLPNRVYNILNLDDTTSLKVQFRKVPRVMRGIDALGSVLRYGENSSYRPQSMPPLDPRDISQAGGPTTEGQGALINNFYQWECVQQKPDTREVEPAKTPEVFQLFNEMVFRAFFGSVDGIEYKEEKIKSMFPFEMIPFEYFTKPKQD
jgi:hypothetical protein